MSERTYGTLSSRSNAAQRYSRSKRAHSTRAAINRLHHGLPPRTLRRHPVTSRRWKRYFAPACEHLALQFNDNTPGGWLATLLYGHFPFRNVPFSSSLKAFSSSNCVFITIGPYHATGSFKGFPETRRKRTPSLPASTVISSPLPNTTRDRLPASFGGEPNFPPPPKI